MTPGRFRIRCVGGVRIRQPGSGLNEIAESSNKAQHRFYTNKDRWHPIEERFTEDNAKPPGSTMETDDVALSDEKSETACNTHIAHCP